MHTVLVVVDDCDTCRNLADLLDDCGYRVHTAASGDIALMAREERYDGARPASAPGAVSGAVSVTAPGRRAAGICGSGSDSHRRGIGGAQGVSATARWR